MMLRISGGPQWFKKVLTGQRKVGIVGDFTRTQYESKWLRFLYTQVLRGKKEEIRRKNRTYKTLHQLSPHALRLKVFSSLIRCPYRTTSRKVHPRPSGTSFGWGGGYHFGGGQVRPGYGKTNNPNCYGVPLKHYRLLAPFLEDPGTSRGWATSQKCVHNSVHQAQKKKPPTCSTRRGGIPFKLLREISKG